METDSGNSNSSIFSVSTTSWLPALLAPATVVWVLGELSFIRDAGVAGDATPGLGG